jgi:hypothetical protein
VETLKALESQLHGEESDDDYEMEPQVGQYALPTGETVQSVQRCSQITPFHKRDGELLVGELNCYFMDTHQFKTEEEEKRRYTSGMLYKLYLFWTGLRTIFVSFFC